MTAVIPCHPRESGEQAGIQKFGSGYAGLGRTARDRCIAAIIECGW